MYSSFPHHDDVEIFRMTSPFAQGRIHSNSADALLEKSHVQNVFADHWSRESTVNPQDLLAQPENA